MKIKKFSNKILESASFEEKEKCKKLFSDLFHNEFGVYSIVITDLNNMYCKINVPITNDTYKYFLKFFEFLNEIGLQFSLNNNDISIYLNNGINNFIRELEILKNTEKYNL